MFDLVADAVGDRAVSVIPDSPSAFDVFDAMRASAPTTSAGWAWPVHGAGAPRPGAALELRRWWGSPPQAPARRASTSQSQITWSGRPTSGPWSKTTTGGAAGSAHTS